MYSNSARNLRELLGKDFTTNTSGNCFVVDYVNNRNVIVIFYDPIYITSCELGDLRKGKVKNPLYPSVYGKGYLGIGKYSTKDKEAYGLWMSMLKRSYCDEFKVQCPSYEDVTVCDEWLNFQNFAEWCYSQKFFNSKDEEGRVYHLDKDGIIKGNKVYSPEACCFVPQEINKLWQRKVKNSGKYLTGVNLHKDGKRFISRIVLCGKTKYLGVFNTQEDAVASYHAAKDDYIKNISERYKDVVDNKVYEILLNMDFTFWD